MPVTPRFKLSQDEATITVHIDAPYVKFSDSEMRISDNEFSFYCKPYLLKLYFSGEVVEDGNASANYDVDKGQFTIKVPKLNEGEQFLDLDMQTKLMTPSRQPNTIKANTLIEIMNSGTMPEGCPCGVEDCECVDVDWSIEQTVPEECPILSSSHYGFNLAAAGVFKVHAEAQHELLDIEAPDDTPIHERGAMQLEHENSVFDADHYMTDMIDDEKIRECILFKTSASRIHRQIRKGNVVFHIFSNLC